VAAGLDPLGDHSIRARLGCGLRLVDRPALVDPGGSGEPARGAPKRHDHVGGSCRLHIAGPNERQQQIDRNRPWSQPARGGHLRSDRRTRAGDRPETTSLRNRHREFVTRNEPHAGLNDRYLQAAHINDRGHR
jgi:hypothetical protein